VVALFFIVRQTLRDSRCSEYCFCQKCVAVDSDELGQCPICGATLKEKAIFMFISDKDEVILLKRRGLESYTWKAESQNASRS
jgi:RNA polymerase subunit RPABC4/transcription elongation factor Spt4